MNGVGGPAQLPRNLAYLHSAAWDFVSQLVTWAEVLPGSRQAVHILFDGLDLVTTNGFQVQHDLRRMLKYGPEWQVWPVVPVNHGRLARLETWLEYFQTRLLVQLKRREMARLLVGYSEINLVTMQLGKQFGLSWLEGWPKFWLSTVE